LTPIQAKATTPKVKKQPKQQNLTFKDEFNDV